MTASYKATHEFTPENTYTWRGHRNCRICNRAHAAAVRAKGVQS